MQKRKINISHFLLLSFLFIGSSVAQVNRAGYGHLYYDCFDQPQQPRIEQVFEGNSDPAGILAYCPKIDSASFEWNGIDSNLPSLNPDLLGSYFSDHVSVFLRQIIHSVQASGQSSNFSKINRIRSNLSGDTDPLIG